MLNDKSFHRVPEMIRALIPACVSLQIFLKMGMKVAAPTAALFWSVEHVFCIFEVGIFPPPIFPSIPTSCYRVNGFQLYFFHSGYDQLNGMEWQD